jgi:hypothetical protein
MDMKNIQDIIFNKNSKNSLLNDFVLLYVYQ